MMRQIKPQFTSIMQPQFNRMLVASRHMSTLAERVTEAISLSGTDVQQVAKTCGISVQAVYKWMNGASKTIAGEHLVELARITNFEARWIISGKGEKRKDPKAVAVYIAMQTMPEYKKDVLVKTSSALAEPDEDGDNKQ
jgi:hypothetical protein